MVACDQSILASESETVKLAGPPAQPQSFTSDPRIVRRFRRLATTLGLCVSAIAALASVSWITGIVFLRRFVSFHSEVKPNTALALAAAGLALCLFTASFGHRVRCWLVRGLATVTSFIAALTLAEFLIGRDLGIDNALVRLAGSHLDTGRMAPHTALGLLFAGASLFLLTLQKPFARMTGQLCALLTGTFSLIALFGYTFRMTPLYKLGEPSFMALPTAFSLACLCLGSLLATSERGLLSPLTATGGGGMMLRRVLPLALLGPWAIGWLAVKGSTSGVYGGDTDDALAVLALMTFLTVLLFLNARALNRLDAENERSRELLQRSSEQWQLTFNCMSEGLSYHDTDYNIVRTNTAFDNLLSRSCGAGEKCYKLVHGSDAPPPDCPMRKTLATGETARAEIYEPRLGRHLQVRTDPVRDASGNIFRIVHVVEDITERKDAEAHLRRLAAIVESSQDAIYSLDTEGHIFTWNRAAESMFGYTAEEILGSTPEVLYPVNDRQRWRRLHEEILNGGRFENLEMRRLRKDGTEFDVSLSVSPLRGNEGTVVGTSAICRDVTARNLAQAEAQRQGAEAQRARAQLKAVFDSMGEGLYQLDFDGRLVYMNAAAEQMLGYTLSEIQGRSMHEVIHSHLPDGTPRSVYDSPLVKVIAHGETHHEDEAYFRRKDGSFFPTEYTSSPFIVDGAIHGAVLSFRDISERKRAEQERSRLLHLEREARMELARLNSELEERVRLRTAELEVSNRELEAFSYSVSHDLRAPLRSIDGFSHILLDEYDAKLDDEGRDFLNRLRNASQQMGQLIDALLMLSRVSRSDMTKAEVNLSALARQIASELQNTAPERSVEFNIAENVSVMGDSRLLRSALQNLIGNAWKFTSRVKHTVIEFGITEKDGNHVYFVRDNGAGFEMEYARKLFVAFQRLHSASEFEGSGIGLATVQRIIRRHGGTVWAEGEPGVGATFYFTLS